MPTPELCIIAGCLVLLSVIQATFYIHTIHEARETTRKAIEGLTRMAESALIARGGPVNPHVVNPEVFGPTGMARRDESTLAPAPAPSMDDESEEERAVREAEAEYFQQQALYDQATGRRMSPRQGSPPGASSAA